MLRSPIRIRRLPSSVLSSVSVSAAIVAGLVLAAPGKASAAATTQDWLITGNGHGFQIYEKYDPAAATTLAKLVAFYDYPYRYIKSKGNTSVPGVPHRNLLASGKAEQPVVGDGVYFKVDGVSTAGVEPAMSYLEQTHIVQVDQSAASQAVQSYFFAPFDFPHNATIALLHAEGARSAELSLDFKIGVDVAGDPTGENVTYDSTSKAWIEAGSLGAIIYLPLNTAAELECNGGGYAADAACEANSAQVSIRATLESGWMGVAIVHTTDAAQASALAAEFRSWQGDKTPGAVLDGAKSEFAAWRKPPPDGVVLSADEELLWRQSETVLRMGQVQTEGGSKGLFLAGLKSFNPAPDFADWSIPWTRDGMYAIVPMAMIGHVDEARAAVQGFMMAPQVGQLGVNDVYFDTAARSAAEVKPYRISVTRYFGDGSEESDLGNSQWNPQPDYNVEVDGWGLYLWAVRHYLSADREHARAWLEGTGYNGDTTYDLLLSEVARPLEVYLEEPSQDGSRIVAPDASIWEDHNNSAVHYAYTTFTAARGFCDLAAIVSAYTGDPNNADAVRFRDYYQALEKGLQRFKYDDALRTAVERLDLGDKSSDGAVIEAYNFGLLRSDDSAYAKTMELLDQPNAPGLRTAAGGFRRRNINTFEYEYSQWGLLTFRAAEAYQRMGNATRAEEIFQTVMANAKANYFLLPELYKVDSTPPGAYFGSRPMVGYAAGAFMMYVLTRAHMADVSQNFDVGLTPEGLPNCSEDAYPAGSAGAGTAGAGGTGGAASAGGATAGGGVSTGSGGLGSTGSSGQGNAAPIPPASSSSCLCSAPGGGTHSGASLTALVACVACVAASLMRRRRSLPS